MCRKKNSTVRETQYGGDAESSTGGYKACRKSIGLYWESEGLIVPFEDEGQHNPRLRKGALLCSCNQRAEDQEIA